MSYNWTPRLAFPSHGTKKPQTTKKTTLTAIQWGTSFICQPFTHKSAYIYWSLLLCLPPHTVESEHLWSTADRLALSTGALTLSQIDKCGKSHSCDHRSYRKDQNQRITQDRFATDTRNNLFKVKATLRTLSAWTKEEKLRTRVMAVFWDTNLH